MYACNQARRGSFFVEEELAPERYIEEDWKGLRRAHSSSGSAPAGCNSRPPDFFL